MFLCSVRSIFQIAINGRFISMDTPLLIKLSTNSFPFTIQFGAISRRVSPHYFMSNLFAFNGGCEITLNSIHPSILRSNSSFSHNLTLFTRGESGYSDWDEVTTLTSSRFGIFRFRLSNVVASLSSVINPSLASLSFPHLEAAIKDSDRIIQKLQVGLRVERRYVESGCRDPLFSLSE